MSSKTQETAPATSTEIRQSSSDILKFSAKIGVGLASIALLSGCASPSPSPTSTEYLTPDNATVNSFQSPEGACDPEIVLYQSDETILDKAARACLDIYHRTSVALVNYSLKPTDAERLAVGIQDRFDETSNGLIHVDVTLVEASAEARKLFEKQNPKGCVDINNLKRYASYDAAVTMPSLSPFDKIIGVSNDTSCQPNTQGVTNPLYDRYSDEFSILQSTNEVKANHGKLIVMKKINGKPTEVKDLVNTKDVAAHELGHLFGMGHSGTLTSNGVNVGTYLMNFPNGVSLDLNDFVARGDYQEYAGDDLMGNNDDLPANSKFNIPEMYQLEWPEHVLDKRVSLKGIDIQQQKVHFSTATRPETIAIATLNTGLRMPTGSGSFVTDFGSEQNYQTIAFVPSFISGEESNKRIFAGVEAYLIGSSNNVVDLGLILAQQSNGPAKYVLEVGGITIDITTDPATNSLSIATQHYLG